MANIIPPRPRAAVSRRAFAMVASQFNAEYVQGLVTHATNELRRLAPHMTLSLYQVPGAFEIPIVVNELAAQRDADAIIAMAVILKGKTGHAENLSHSVTNALQQIAVEHGVPVVNVVLSLTTEAQARERCLEEKINRGTEAAQVAIEIANVMADLRAKQSNG
jgi:6,7-dimethyl-8-ribityllumazine synthase